MVTLWKAFLHTVMTDKSSFVFSMTRIPLPILFGYKHSSNILRFSTNKPYSTEILMAFASDILEEKVSFKLFNSKLFIVSVTNYWH